MVISMIAAVAENNVIGKGNALPWNLPDDMKYFMKTTSGHPVIMGRKNYDSIPDKFRPLPNRVNIVVTRQNDWKAEGCHVVHSMEEAMELAQTCGVPEAFIIGGSEIYKDGFPYAQRLYLTEIKASVPGDVFFPSFEKKAWKEVSRVPHAVDARHPFAFDYVVYEKKQGADADAGAKSI